jgi:two-component system NtrC family response regulator
MQQNILIIDDEKKLNGLLTRIIELEGYKVFQAYTGKEGLKILAQEEIQVVISDVKLPDVNGVDLVKQIKEKQPYVEVINLTAFGTIADGVLSIKNGAFDYITKGDDNDKILPMLARAMDKAQLQLQVFKLQNKIVKAIYVRWYCWAFQSHQCCHRPRQKSFGYRYHGTAAWRNRYG